MRFCLAQLLILLAATSASAQIGIGRPNRNNLPGDGTLPVGSLNITQALLTGLGDDGTGMNDLRSVVRVPGGNYIVAQGQNGGAVKKYMEIAPDGTVLLSIDQPFLNGANGDRGLQGMGWDQDTSSDSRIWAGRARAMASYDWQNQVFDPIFNPANPGVGLKVLSNYQGNDVRAGTVVRINGLQVYVSADNEEGDGTNYHVIGLPLPDAPLFQPSTPAINPPIAAFDNGRLGGAYDPVNGTVWWHIDARASNPNPNHSATRFFEMSLDGTLTGQIIQGDRSIGGRAGGCDMYVDDFGDLVLAYLVSAGSGADNPLMIPGGEDVLVEIYGGFNYGGSCGGEIAFQTEPYAGNADWTVTLENAPVNPLSVAFLFRGRAVLPPGLTLPGLINCGLLLNLGSLIAEGGSLPLVNGESSWVRPLPGDASLIGAEAAFQWLLPTTVTVLPLDLSDAGAIMISSNL